MLEVLDLRDVRMAVDDGLAVLEPRREPRLASHARSGVVDQADPEAADLDDVLSWQHGLQSRLVHVPAHALHRWPEGAELVEERRRDEVAGVQDEICAAQQLQARVRERPRAARQMCVGDDGDAAQGAAVTSPGSCRKRPAFQTSSPSA